MNVCFAAITFVFVADGFAATALLVFVAAGWGGAVAFVRMTALDGRGGGFVAASVWKKPKAKTPNPKQIPNPKLPKLRRELTMVLTALFSLFLL